MEPAVYVVGYDFGTVLVWVASALWAGIGLGILISALVVSQAHRRGWV